MSFRATILSVVAALALAGNVHDRAFYEAKFFNWVSEFKIQATNGEHFARMIQNFANNEDIINAHNGQNSTYTLGHNQFSHLSLDEWRAQVHLGLGKPENAEPTSVFTGEGAVLAETIDWEKKGSVTGVKDQGQCGSCWSFSATGALEGAHHIKHGALVSFSEQHLVDCDNFKHGGSDLACNGGLMDSAFKWVQKNGGINTEADYGYTSGTTKKAGTCSEKPTKYAAVTGYTDVANSDAALKAALNKQPVSVAIQADQTAFQLYKSGVFTAACGTALDHGVLAVGYGSLDGVGYYRVKNSWGTSWGDKGYILLASDIAQVGGQCGILSGPPSFPAVA